MTLDTCACHGGPRCPTDAVEPPAVRGRVEMSACASDDSHSGTRFARRRRLMLAVGPRDVCVVGNTSTPAHLEYRSRRPVPGTEATPARAPSLVRIGRSVTYERRPVAQVGVGGRVFVRSHLIRRGAVFDSLRQDSGFLALTSGADGKLQMPMKNMTGTANQK